MVNNKERYNLTDLEWDLAKLIANGFTIKEISLKLSLTSNKINKMIKDIIHKTNSVNKISAIYTLFKPE